METSAAWQRHETELRSVGVSAVVCVVPDILPVQSVLSGVLRTDSSHMHNVVGTLSWPWMSVGRLRDTALVRCDLCVYGGGVLAAVCGASDVWCTGL